MSCPFAFDRVRRPPSFLRIAYWFSATTVSAFGIAVFGITRNDPATECNDAVQSYITFYWWMRLILSGE